LARLAHPFVLFLNGSTNFFLNLFRIKPTKETPITEEEIKVLIDQGTQAGLFHEVEQEMIERVFRLADRRVSVLMTPRTDIFWLNLDDPPETIKTQVAQHPYSVFPVAHGSLDNLIGVVRSKDLLSAVMKSESFYQDFTLRSLCKKPLYVIDTMSALKALDLFKQSEMRIAFVVDEYGVIQGVITLDNISESIFEDMPNTSTASEKSIVLRDDGSWLIAGDLPLDEFTDALLISRIPDEERQSMDTLNGFIMAQLGKVPSEGDTTYWRNFKLEVVDMDGRRVDKVLVSSVKS
jgi:putative hemolysin